MVKIKSNNQEDDIVYFINDKMNETNFSDIRTLLAKVKI